MVTAADQVFSIFYLRGSFKRGSLRQEDGDDDIGEGGGEVDHLAAGLDAIEETGEVDAPDDENGKHHPPGRAASKIPEFRRHPENLLGEVDVGAGLAHGRGEGEGFGDLEAGIRTCVAGALRAGEDALFLVRRLPSVPACLIPQHLY